MKRTLASWIIAMACGASALAACTGVIGDDTGDGGNRAGAAAPGAGSLAGESSAANGDAQTPPQGADAVEAWLAQGYYKQWAAEAAVHESRDPSPHGYNRIFSNDLVAKNAASKADWPAGAAAVKELYASDDDDKPVGYAVYLKAEADSADGANWYWYERVPLDHPAPHDAKGVVADGFGDQGPAKTICVSCHAAAGTDRPHTPTAGGRDQVYTPVP
jgi:hypothetical protein